MKRYLIPLLGALFCLSPLATTAEARDHHRHHHHHGHDRDRGHRYYSHDRHHHDDWGRRDYYSYHHHHHHDGYRVYRPEHYEWYGGRRLWVPGRFVVVFY